MKTRVAIYCRVSKEDEDQEQSESIKNQENSLLTYVKEKQWQLVNCYIDDGYSGTNFDRPAFKKMIQDIKEGLIDCVITKDYSRLGREHIQTSHYTEVFFPQHGIRYIAVNDGIDTSNSDEFLSFRAVFNDMYARDISKKIRYTLRNKQKEGAFIGAFAPYGYRKDPQNNNRLIIDIETAFIVEKIFHLYLKGFGKSRIANYLNQQNISSPASTKSGYYKKSSLWSPLAVKRILENEVYLGHTIQHKREKISYKIKKQITIPPESWIKVENTHAAIIDEETFNQVQDIIRKRRKSGYSTGKQSKLFTGLLKCTLCGKNYVYSKSKKLGSILICGSYKRYYSQGCRKQVIEETKLRELLTTELKSMFDNFIDQSLLSENLHYLSVSKEKINQSEKVQESLQNLDNKLNIIYQDRLNGILTQDQFLLFRERLEKKKFSLQEQLSALEKKKKKLSQENKNSQIEKLIKEFLQLKKLKRNILLLLIDKIEIISPTKIKIHYKIKPP